MNLGIRKTVRIINGIVAVDGTTVLEDREQLAFPEFIRAAYKFAGMSYPKFYKMDNLCKLALIASEFLLKDTDVIERHGKDQLGLIVQNASSTYDTDMEYQATIDDHANYFPSPAVFVYTLPNIMLGEICIRHKIFGENSLLVEPAFHPESLVRWVELMFDQKRMTACIAGWIEQKGSAYDAFLYLVEGSEGPQENIVPHSIAELSKNYQITHNKN